MASVKPNKPNKSFASAAEAARSVSEMTLEAGMFMVSLDAMIVMSADGIIAEFNPAAERIFGWKRQEAVGRELAEVVIPAKIRNDHRRGLARYLKTGAGKFIDRRVEVSAVRKNGEEFPAELYISRVSQDPPVFMGTIRDVTGQKRAEAAVKSNEQRWLALIENSSEGIALLSLDAKILFISSSAAGILGYTPEEMIRVKNLESFTHPDDRERVRQKLSPLVRSGASTSYRARAKDGSYRWVAVVVKNAVDDPNVGGVIINFRDITAEKRALDRLAASERRYKFVVQNASDVITVYGHDGAISYQSPSIAKLLGLKDVRVGGNIFNSPLVHPSDSVAKTRFLKKLIHSKPETELTGEFRMLHADGSWRTLDVVGTNMLHIPEVGGVVLSSRDITERKLTEDQRDEFIAVASHELKTPVTSMKTYAAMLERKFRRSGDEKAAAAVHAMDEQLNRLSSLVSDVLDASRAETGQLGFIKAPFDYSETVKQVVQSVRLTTDKHVIRYSGVSQPIRIVADSSRLSQVLINLVENAIKYSPDGGPVRVSVRCSGGELVTCVSDNGIGIAKNRQARLFERFARIGDRRTSGFPGLGLGLYIAARIIDQMGGRIWVKSLEGEGSKFYFNLPLAKLK